MIGEPITRDNIGWNDPPDYDRGLGRMRTPSDDFFDHRKSCQESITAAMKRERSRTSHRKHR